MTPEEQLAKILKQNQNIVFGKTIGTDADGNCTVQTGESSILARSGGQVSAGDCVAMKADDGQWYAVSSRVTGTVQRSVLFSRKNRIVDDAEIGNAKALYFSSSDAYVGGDRTPAELVYTPPDGYSILYYSFQSLGEGQDDWILTCLSAKTGSGAIAPVWEKITINISTLSGSRDYECYLIANDWFIAVDPQGYGYSSVDGRLATFDGSEYYVRNARLQSFYSADQGQLYLRFQLSETPIGAISEFPLQPFNEADFADRFCLATITPESTIETKDSGIRVINYTIAGTPVKNILDFTPYPSGYGWWVVKASQLSHWYLSGGLHSRWNGIKANFRIEQDTPIPVTVYNTPSFVPDYQQIEINEIPDNASGSNGDFRIEGATETPKLYKKIGGTWVLQPSQLQNFAPERVCSTIPLVIDDDLSLTTHIVGHRKDYVSMGGIGSIGGGILWAYGFISSVQPTRFYGIFPVSGVNADNYISSIGFDPATYFRLIAATEDGAVNQIWSRGLGENLVLETGNKIRYYQGDTFAYLSTTTRFFLDRTELGYLSNGLAISVINDSEFPEVRVYSLSDLAVDGQVRKQFTLLPSEIDGDPTPVIVHRLLTLDEFNDLDDVES